VVVVVDAQEAFRSVVAAWDAVIAGCRKLLEAARWLDVPIVVTEQYPRGLGQTARELTQVVEGVPLIEKMSFSAWGAERFRSELNALRRGTVVLCGVESHVCVLQTAHDLADAGFSVHVACDAIDSRKPLDRELALTRMSEAGVQLTTVEMILFELLERADVDAFKPVHSLIR
jgi:nicotinamidase-related amidase